MKARLLASTAVFLVVITALHVQLNIGWQRAADALGRLWTGERAELQVGFLPVT